MMQSNELKKITLNHPLIIGGGIVGMILALGLRQMGVSVTVLDGADGRDARFQKDDTKSHKNANENINENGDNLSLQSLLPKDLRTVALWQGSVNLLKNLGVWEMIIAQDSHTYTPVPLEKLRLITPSKDKTSVASQVDFNAHDLNMETLGYNVPISRLQQALMHHCDAMGVTIHHNTPIDRVDYDGTTMTVTTDAGTAYTAPVVLSCEGRHSPIRTYSNTPMVVNHYDLSALVCMVRHSEPHHHISQEIHHPNGPFTFVPMQDVALEEGNLGDEKSSEKSHMSALVWVDKTDTMTPLGDMKDPVFNGIMQDKSLNILGDLSVVGQRQIFPLTCQYAKTMGGTGYVLLGESAHVLPPFAAQGMNLSLRDVAEYLHQLETALTTGHAMGDATIVAKYQNNRLPDIRARVMAVTTLHTMVFNKNPVLHTLRTKGMGLLNKVSPLRQGVMAMGMQGVGGDPIKMKFFET